MEGILVGVPFTAAGEAQLVLDMPDAGELDGVIVTLLAALQTQAVSDLDGAYVLRLSLN